jgi:tetratricopeptide (TPR) repeat protein
MKTKLGLLIVIALIGSTVRVQSDETLNLGRRWLVQMYDDSAGQTMTKGTELAESENYEKARQYFDAAIRRDPKEWPPYFSRALVFAHEQKWALAAQDLNTVLQFSPTNYLAAIFRGWMNERLGNYKSSLAEYDRILSLRPLPLTRALTLNSRAWLRATCPDASLRNAQKAIADAKAACNLTAWGKPNHIDTLAAACAEAGDFASAVRFEQQALAHEREEANRKAYGHRLSMYQAQHPFRYASR